MSGKTPGPGGGANKIGQFSLIGGLKNEKRMDNPGLDYG